MKETDVEIVLEAAKENYPHAKPRIISDNARRAASTLMRNAPLSRSG